MTTVNLIARDNGAGLSVDLRTVADALTATGFDVTVTALGHRSRLVGKLLYGWSRVRGRWQRLTSDAPRYRHDINLMLERVQPELLADARHNVLIPNPEWFHGDWHRWLPRLDRVLVKTRHAGAAFEALGCHTRYVGFSSRGSAGEAKNASRTPLVDHSVKAPGQYFFNWFAPTASVTSSRRVSSLT